jgi:hypothetical protein
MTAIEAFYKVDTLTFTVRPFSALPDYVRLVFDASCSVLYRPRGAALSAPSSVVQLRALTNIHGSQLGACDQRHSVMSYEEDGRLDCQLGMGACSIAAACCRALLALALPCASVTAILSARTNALYPVTKALLIERCHACSPVKYT